MGDRSAMMIKIGGPVPANLIPMLADLATDHGLEDGDGCVLTEAVDNALGAGEPLKLYDSERSGGMAEEFEAELRDLGLTYARFSDACPGAYAASMSYWRPGFDEPRTWSTADDVPMLSVGDIKHLRLHGLLELEVQTMEEALSILPLTRAPDVEPAKPAPAERDFLLSDRELATVLAALRNWQEETRINGRWPPTRYADHFTEHAPLAPAEIDALCERLNCGPTVSTFTKADADLIFQFMLKCTPEQAVAVGNSPDVESLWQRIRAARREG